MSYDNNLKNGDNNKVKIFFDNLKNKITQCVNEKNFVVLREIKEEILYLLLKNQQCQKDKKILSESFQKQLNKNVNYLNKILCLNESLNNRKDKKNSIYNSKNNNNKKNNFMDDNNNNKITKKQIKNIINEVLNEIELDIEEPSDSIDSTDDFAADYIKDLLDTVKRLISRVENNNDVDAYKQLVNIHDKLNDAISNPRLSHSEKEKLEHDYEGILGLIHSVIGGGGSGEKFYMREIKQLIDEVLNEILNEDHHNVPILNERQKALIEKWCNEIGCREASIKIIDSILRRKIGLSSSDLADSTTFMNGLDSMEEILEDSRNYQEAYNIGYDTAMEMIEEEGGGGLFECGDWESAKKHPQFKEVLLKEKAPPGYSEETMHDIKAGLRKAHPNWPESKVVGVAFATAWKNYYKK